MQLLSADYCELVCDKLRTHFPDAAIVADPLDLIRYFPSVYITLGWAHFTPAAYSFFDTLPPIYLTEPPPARASFTLTLSGPTPGLLRPGLHDAPVRIIGRVGFGPPPVPRLLISE